VSRDLVLGTAALALAAGYYAMAAGIQESALSDAVGPQGLPKTYAIVLGALSLILIVRSVRPADNRNAPPSPHPLPPSMGRAAGIVAIGAIYIALVPWLGYVLSLAILIAATTYYQGGGMTRRVGLVAASGALFFWVLFVFFLGIAHPPGFWPALF
jgi:hypothetical protein